MIVCHCNNITDGTIRRLVREGASSGDIVRACEAGRCCGGCRPLIDRLVAVEREREECPRAELVPAV